MWPITDFPQHLLVVATALLASLSLTPAALRLAIYFGVVDHPGPRKVHLTPMPLWGGMAMYGATALTTLVFLRDVDAGSWLQILGIVSASGLLVIVGSLDDGGLLHHQIKLFVAMPIAALILIACGIRAVTFTTAFGDAPIWMLTDVVVTLLWVVGITAAFSILDHMDGLCAGVAAVAATFYLGYAVSGGQILVGTLAAAVLGASLGFLKWNFNPARIFMGDGGAMFLGFMMATLGLKLRVPHAAPLNAALIPVFILGVPIFDTTLVTVSRLRRGLVPFASPGKDHTSHRLTTLGMAHRSAVLVMYGVGAASGLIAVLLGRSDWSTAAWIGAASAVAAAVAIIALERCAFERTPSGAARSSTVQ